MAEVMQHPFLNMLTWPEKEKYKAARKGLFYLMLPLGLYISLSCGYLTFSWWGAVLFTLLGVSLMLLSADWQASGRVSVRQETAG